MTVATQEVQATSPEVTKTHDVNFANMRKQLEAERAEKAQMKQELDEMRKASQKSVKVQDEDDDMGGEPYIDPKTFKKKIAIERENIKKEAKEEIKQEMRQMLEEEKRISYLKQNNDFDQIMAPEVIQKFADKHPGLAESILRMPDGFDRQRLVYEAIKNTGAHKKEESAPSIQQKIDANRKNSYYQPSGVGSAPYGGQGDFSDTGKKTAYDQMIALKKRLRLG